MPCCAPWRPAAPLRRRRHAHRPGYLHTACEASLKRLGLERIDLFQFHIPDPKVPLEDSIRELARLRAAGKIRHIGVSNVGYRASEEVLRYRETHGLVFLPWAPLRQFARSRWQAPWRHAAALCFPPGRPGDGGPRSMEHRDPWVLGEAAMNRSLASGPICAAALILLACGVAVPAEARRYQAAELNTEQYRALDRTKTVVILTQGMFEEHGPYLPAYTDGYAAERLAKDVADAIVARGWNALMFPDIPFGSGGVNEIPAKYPFPGTFALHVDTLRSIYMELADELGEAGFKYIFVFNSHGAPNHNRVIDQAAAYFGDTWGGRMVKLSGFDATAPDGADPAASLSEQARREDNNSGHGGIVETSETLFLAPQLVDPAYRSAPAFTVGNEGMLAATRRNDWLGYFGAPRYATAAQGAKLFELRSRACIQQALAVLDGTAPRAQPARNPGRGIDDASIARDRAAAKRQQDWLQKNGYR